MKEASSRQVLRIVIVDDEPRIHETISEILKKAKLIDQHESFFDPVSFLEFLKQQKISPDLILLDVHFENSGLSGVDIIPFIREDFPYLPVVLLTGMEGAEIEGAQNFDFIYYIPKPVSPQQLVRMINFYLGLGRKSGRRSAELSQELAEHKKLVQLLKTELAEAEIASWDEKTETHAKAHPKSFDRIMEILSTVLKNFDLMPSFVHDMERLFDSEFKLFKNTIDTIIRFEMADVLSPGLNVHKYQGIENVYTLRLSKKARLFFSQSLHMSKKRLKLIRLDPEHDTKGMDKWLKANYGSFIDS